jgi:hypothetical protein
VSAAKLLPPFHCVPNLAWSSCKVSPPHRRIYDHDQLVALIKLARAQYACRHLQQGTPVGQCCCTAPGRPVHGVHRTHQAACFADKRELSPGQGLKEGGSP